MVLITSWAKPSEHSKIWQAGGTEAVLLNAARNNAAHKEKNNDNVTPIHFKARLAADALLFSVAGTLPPDTLLWCKSVCPVQRGLKG